MESDEHVVELAFSLIFFIVSLITVAALIILLCVFAFLPHKKRIRSVARAFGSVRSDEGQPLVRSQLVETWASRALHQRFVYCIDQKQVNVGIDKFDTLFDTYVRRCYWADIMALVIEECNDTVEFTFSDSPKFKIFLKPQHIIAWTLGPENRLLCNHPAPFRATLYFFTIDTRYFVALNGTGCRSKLIEHIFKQYRLRTRSTKYCKIEWVTPRHLRKPHVVTT